MVEVSHKARHSGVVIERGDGRKSEAKVRDREVKKGRIEPKGKPEVLMDAGSK